MSPFAFSPPTSPLSFSLVLFFLSFSSSSCVVAPSVPPGTEMTRSSARQTGNSQRTRVPELEGGGGCKDSEDYDQPGCLVKKETGQLNASRRDSTEEAARSSSPSPLSFPPILLPSLLTVCWGYYLVPSYSSPCLNQTHTAFLVEKTANLTFIFKLS